MKILCVISIICYSLNLADALSIPIISDIQDIISLAGDISNLASGAIPFMELFSNEKNPLDDVLTKIDGVSEQIDKLDSKLDDILAKLIARLPLEDNINSDIRDLQSLISKIDTRYEEFLEYTANIEDFSNETLLEFIGDAVSNQEGHLQSMVIAIFNIIVPKKTALNRVGFLENMVTKRNIMTTLEMCDSSISFQYQLYQILSLISATEMKAYIMRTIAIKMKDEFDHILLSGELKQTESGFVMRMDQYLIEFRKNMAKASREIFLCDPQIFKERENYIEFEGLFTSYVINEIQGFDDSCSENCGAIFTWGHTHCYAFSGKYYCPRRACQGLVYHCEWIGGRVDICDSFDNTSKRYEWIHSHANGWYGKETKCYGGHRKLDDRSSGLYKCDMCLCKCEESYGRSRATRTFSLRPQISNIEENKVVSDVKFVEKDKMIHIQIEESPLLPLGQVDKNQSSWVPLEDYVYNSNTDDGAWALQKDGNTFLKRDVDYAFIRREQRLINLDQISAGPNYVLTGVKLSHESEEFIKGDASAGNVSPLQLEIHVTPFDYAEGTLVPTEENPSIWLTPTTQPNVPQAYAKKREKIKIGSKTYKYETSQNTPNISPNQFIEFQQSSIFDDAGQSTIPFMDSRPTAPFTSLAFDGLGLIYRGHPKYAGFLAFKPMTISLTNYVDSAMTNEQRKFYRKSYRKVTSNTSSKRTKKRE